MYRPPRRWPSLLARAEVQRVKKFEFGFLKTRSLWRPFLLFARARERARRAIVTFISGSSASGDTLYRSERERGTLVPREFKIEFNARKSLERM